MGAFCKYFLLFDLSRDSPIVTCHVFVQISLPAVKAALRHILTNAPALTALGRSDLGVQAGLRTKAIVVRTGISRCKVGHRPLEHLISTWQGFAVKDTYGEAAPAPWRWSLQVILSPIFLVLSPNLLKFCHPGSLISCRFVQGFSKVFRWILVCFVRSDAGLCRFSEIFCRIWLG